MKNLKFSNASGIVFKILYMQISKDQLYQAYLDARKGKSKKRQIIKREENLSENMDKLYQEIISGEYQITAPSRHIVLDPVARELLVLHFRDRIVQHLIYKIIAPTRDKQFIYDSYSNRKGKGTLKAIQRTSRFMRSVSDCYSQDAYVMKLDIQSFFVSIDRDILWKLVSQKIDDYNIEDKDGLLKIIHHIIFYDYIGQCRDFTTKQQKKLLPYQKSLFSVTQDKGMPLGNLISQLFANIYLHQLDLFIKHKLGIKYYIRYVDDFVLMHTNKSHLLYCHDKIKTFLYKQLNLTLHPNKFYLQNLNTGCLFLGTKIYPFHRTVKKGTISKCFYKMKNKKIDFDKKYQILMSYTGLSKHHNSYGLAQQWKYIFLSSFE